MEKKFNQESEDILQIEVLDENLENKLINYFIENNIITEEDIKICEKEQKRLSKLGYYSQLSALLYATGTVSLEVFIEAYKKILKDKEFNVVNKKVNYIELDVPKIKKNKKKKKINIEQNIEEILGLISLKEKSKKRKEELMEKDEKDKKLETYKEEDEKSKEEALKEDFIKEEKEVEKEYSKEEEKLEEKEENFIKEEKVEDRDTKIIQKLNEILEILKKIKLEEKKEKDKKRIKGKDVKRLIKKGYKFENYYIEELIIYKENIGKEIFFKDCIIERLELKEINFLENVTFENVYFNEKATFKGSKFEKNAVFKYSIFENGADFSKIEFKGEVNFNTALFRRYVSFNRTIFEKRSIFSRSSFQKGVKFTNATFKEPVSLNDIYCDHRFFLDNSEFQETVTFSNSNFNEVSDFSNTIFNKETKFKGTIFNKEVNFRNAKFKEDINLKGAKVGGDLIFESAEFEGIINLKTLCAEKNVIFNNAKIGKEARFIFLDAYFGRLFVHKEQIQGHLDSELNQDYKIAQKEYGLLKNNFRDINLYEIEDWAYHMEKRMARKSVKPTGIKNSLYKFFDWLALDLACGYGTKPLNIFMTSFIILLFFGIIYYLFDAEFILANEITTNNQIIQENMTFLDAIQVSFRLFTNSSVGGWEARGDSWINYIMMLESFLGLFVMTILIVTFSRKVVR